MNIYDGRRKLGMTVKK